MNALVKCWEELSKARIEIEGMRGAIDLNALVGHWEYFLIRLERSWYKSVCYMNANRRFHGWGERGYAIALRKRDPLLSYLRNARGADHHGVEAVVSQEPGAFTVMRADQEPMTDTVVSFPYSYPYDNGVVITVHAAGAISFSVPTFLTRAPEEKPVANDPVGIDFRPAQLRLKTGTTTTN